MKAPKGIISFYTQQLQALGYDVHVAQGKAPTPLADQVAALRGAALTFFNAALATRGLKLVKATKPKPLSASRRKPTPKK
ncbi:hypothetical protein LJ737_04330 [Hymenobacter sp. 15J16-1T3B]|uniref:hypothetical protein n=1 Tax=Hymenobacter sp. 15J16-1T3B TaxID=2886941 RepID=UPI001D10C6D7|nr:hypothetical protein [Hymenobacter sp. 15J16-1T3B]MCC3156450.1 hypothetical protein [Hymenobacter sp. 15J16-1T3B]